MADVNVPGMEVHSSWTGATIAEFIQRHLDERPGLTSSVDHPGS
jgi:hypothetical protein